MKALISDSMVYRVVEIKRDENYRLDILVEGKNITLDM